MIIKEHDINLMYIRVIKMNCIQSGIQMKKKKIGYIK